MFGLGTAELVLSTVILIGVIVLPLYIAYRYGYNKGYMKAMRDSNLYR